MLFRSGVWFQIDRPERAKDFFAGETPPSSDDIDLIWEYRVQPLSMKAAEAIKSEVINFDKTHLKN